MATTTEVQKRIQELLVEAKAKLAEAEAYADEHGADFYFSVEYGMGGTYVSGEGWEASSGSC